MRRPDCSASVYDVSEATNCCSAATRCDVSSLMFFVAATIRDMRPSLKSASGLSRIASIASVSSRRWPSVASRRLRSSACSSCTLNDSSLTFCSTRASRSRRSAFSIARRASKSSRILISLSRSRSITFARAIRSSTTASSLAARRACHGTMRSVTFG